MSLTALPEKAITSGPARLRAVGARLGWTDLALVMVVAGAVIRIVRWWQNASLWLDEEMIAVNVRDSGFVGLLGNLKYHQVAPLGWLYGERILVKLFGTDERSLRLLPMLLSVATLVAAWLIGRRFLGPVGTFAFVALCAVSPRLIDYATQVKQYSSEGFWALVLVGLAGWLLTRTDLPRSSYLWWAAAIIASWLSLAGTFVAAGTAVLLLVVVWRRAGRPAAIRFVIAGVVWFLSFLVHYAVSLRYTTGQSYLDPYWTDRGGFPAPGGAGHVLSWLAGRPAGLAADPLVVSGRVAVVAFWLLVLAGVAVAAWRRWEYGLLLLIPIVTGVGLGVARLSPLTLRLALWLVPLLLLAAAVAVDAGVRLLAARWRANIAGEGAGTRPVSRAAAAGVGMLLILGTVLFGRTLAPQARADLAKAPSYDRTDDRAAWAWMLARPVPGDLTLITVSSYPGEAWYDPKGALKPGWFVRGVAPGADCDPQRLKNQVRGYRRILAYSGIAIDTNLVIEPTLAELGTVVEKQRFDLGEVWVVDVKDQAPPQWAVDALARQPNPCMQLSTF